MQSFFVPPIRMQGICKIQLGVTEAEHRADNLSVFAFALDDQDRAALEEVFARMTAVPGDCGDEYCKPPFLTASGDLSHHLDAIAPLHAAIPDAAL